MCGLVANRERNNIWLTLAKKTRKNEKTRSGGYKISPFLAFLVLCYTVLMDKPKCPGCGKGFTSRMLTVKVSEVGSATAKETWHQICWYKSLEEDDQDAP